MSEERNQDYAFLVSTNVRSSSDKDGTTILHITRDKVFRIVGVGSAVWEMLARSKQGISRSRIVDQLSSEFETVPRAQITIDVKRLLNNFQQKQLIEVSKNRSHVKPSHDMSAGYWLLLHAPSITALLVSRNFKSEAAFIGLATVDFLLKCVSFTALYQLVKQWPVSVSAPGPSAVDDIIEGVRKAMTWYPKRAMCLQRSVVTVCLLRASGINAQLIIGCQKLPFLMHAWVEVDGEVVDEKQRVQQIHQVLDRC
jgi:hypothetical protein